MCGRVIHYKDPSTYGRALGATGSPNLPPHYNGAPGQDLLVVRPISGRPFLDSSDGSRGRRSAIRRR
jgi:hypothetical protein